MSGIPIVEEPYEALNNADWREGFEFFTADANGVETPRDFTGCAIYGGLRLKDTHITFSTNDGGIVLTTPGRFDVVVLDTLMSTLKPGVYTGDFRVESAANIDLPLLRFQLLVIEGNS